LVSVLYAPIKDETKNKPKTKMDIKGDLKQNKHTKPFDEKI